MAKRRRTINSDPEFLKKLHKLQGKIKAMNGIEPSLTDLTTAIVRTPAFEDVEKQIMNMSDADKLKLKIKYDGKLI